MRNIVPSRIWIGNAFDLRDLRLIHEMEIRAVVDLALEEPIPELTRELIYCRFPILDGSANEQSVLRLAVGTVIGLFEDKIPTIVTCSAGMSRSPCITAAALAMVNSKDFDETLCEITTGHPHDVSPNLWSNVKRTQESN